MTMQNQIHPDDERLSALAGGDPDATGDAALRAHLDGCERCTSLVRDLGELRVALAQLPDLAPSRPLQLIPPVTARAETGAGWLRRLAAPAMAAGAALVVIGGVGMGAVTLGGLASGGATAPAGQEDTARDAPETVGTLVPLTGGASDSTSDRGVTAEGASDRASDGGFRAGEGTDEASGRVPAEGAGDEGTTQDFAAPSVDFNQPTPWLVLLMAGAVLLLLGMVLRNAINPRAG